MAVNIFKDRLRHADLFGKHGLDRPDNPIKFERRPAFPIEAGFFLRHAARGGCPAGDRRPRPH